MKILITESQKRALDELQWLESVTNHMFEHRFPMTPKIYQLISGTQRVRAFHVSDVHQIAAFGKLRGTKKTISTFTYMYASNIGELRGIQTKGGVLYEVFGDLVIHSPNDIMSRPDENGIRWIDEYELLPSTKYVDTSIKSINKQWLDAVRQMYQSNNIDSDDVYNVLSKPGKEKTNLIKQYFLLAEKFVYFY